MTLISTWTLNLNYDTYQDLRHISRLSHILPRLSIVPGTPPNGNDSQYAVWKAEDVGMWKRQGTRSTCTVLKTETKVVHVGRVVDSSHLTWTRVGLESLFL
jgi:hypothetical protein